MVTGEPFMDSRITDARRAAEHVPGWLTDAEGELLFNLAKECTGRGVIVEIGSWKGKSTIWLGRGSQAGQGVKIYAIDPHEGTPGHKRQGELSTLDEFKKNLSQAGVADLVVPLVATSGTAALDFASPVEMIFVDGDHDYASVKLDFDLWFPKVIAGGLMAFHDTTRWDGPKRLVAECVYKSTDFYDASFVCSTTFARKVKRNTLKQRLANRLVLLTKMVWTLIDNLWEATLSGLSKAKRFKIPPKTCQ
jgi:predicted O-methyltransferase YrrM